MRPKFYRKLNFFRGLSFHSSRFEESSFFSGLRVIGVENLLYCIRQAVIQRQTPCWKQTFVEVADSQTVRRSDSGLLGPTTRQVVLPAISGEISATPPVGARHVSHSSSRRILRSLMVLTQTEHIRNLIKTAVVIELKDCSGSQAITYTKQTAILENGPRWKWLLQSTDH